MTPHSEFNDSNLVKRRTIPRYFAHPDIKNGKNRLVYHTPTPTGFGTQSATRKTK